MMSASQASILQSFKTPPIRVVVGTGEDTETYILNKDLVRCLGTFFSNMLKHDCKETQEQIVYLPVDEPRCFESLLHFTIYGKVGFKRTDVQRGQVWLPIRAWIMGEKYRALEFRDACMRFIYEKAYELDIVNIEYVFHYTVQEQHLNLWAVHHICQYYGQRDGQPARLYPATGSAVAEWLHLVNDWEHFGICFMRFKLYDTLGLALLQPCSHYLFNHQAKCDWSLGAEDSVWDKLEKQKQEMLAAMEDDRLEEI